MRPQGFALLFAVLLCAAAVGGQEHDEHGQGAPWSWDKRAPDGPSSWSSSYPECGGEEQSPVDIVPSESIKLNTTRQLVQAYLPTDATLLNNGHNWEVEVPAASGSVLHGGPLKGDYALVNLHFHSPSEHTIDSKRAGAELHLVHRDAKGRRAVVAVLIVEGSDADEDSLLRDFLSAAQQLPNARDTAPFHLHLEDELPAFRRYFHYRGSLTTPPCTEGVDWLVQTTAIVASPSQLRSLRALLGKDRRPVQPLNGRTIQQFIVVNAATAPQKPRKIRTNSSQLSLLLGIGIAAFLLSFAYCYCAKRKRDQERGRAAINAAVSPDLHPSYGSLNV